MDRVRRLVVGIVVLVVVALVALVVVVRPGLRTDADAIDDSWRRLVPALSERYQTLNAVHDALAQSGLGERAVTGELASALERWTVVRTGTDAEDQVVTANRLETLAARVHALAALPRLQRTGGPLALTLQAFEGTRPPPAVVRTYNRDVLAYQEQRDGFWSRIVARLDGYPMRPTLELA